MRLREILACSVLCLTFACKSTTKLYEQGQYDRAVYSALDDLRKRPNSTSAGQVLPSAYREAVRGYENSIHAAQISTTNQKFDILFNNYRALQNMYNAISATPAALALLSPKNYVDELNTAAEDAAEFHYQGGLSFFQQRDRIGARKAYEEFRATESYVPGYKDVEQMKAQAYNLAVMNIVVNKFDQRFGYYNVDAAYFQNDVLSTLNNIGGNYFYRFFDINSGPARDVRVDQYMEVNMYDLFFSKLATDNYSYEVTKDIPIKTDKDGKSSSGTEHVKATVTVTRRVINARLQMDYRISDAATQRMITFDRIPTQYTWEKSTGKYAGDSRALSDKDWAIVRGEFNKEPDENELYRALTRQIMNEFTSRMRTIYGRY